jgi:rod shape-determining protein MreC
MEPSPKRRPGYSRRAQFTTFFGYFSGVLGALIGGALLIIAITNPSSFSGLRNLGRDATAPIGSIAARGRSGGYGVFETISGYIAAGSQNTGLKRQLAAARSRLVENQALVEENRRLKALLGLNQSDPKPLVFARLTASSASSSRRFATLSAGTSSGVQVGMPVRSPLGLVGRVLEVGYLTSRVLLITDSESLVPVRRASDSIPGFAQGRADGTLQIRLISLGINPLKRGDAFVTSGAGGLYRPGTPIAIVDAITRDGAIAKLVSDPSTSEFVAVEPVWNSEPAERTQKPASGGPARP